MYTHLRTGRIYANTDNIIYIYIMYRMSSSSPSLAPSTT